MSPQVQPFLRLDALDEVCPNVSPVFAIEGISDIGYKYKRYLLCVPGETKLTHFPISDSSRRMGRPPLNVKPILVRLPEGMAERIDALVGKNKRAEFIRDALEKELLERERSSEDKTSQK